MPGQIGMGDSFFREKGSDVPNRPSPVASKARVAGHFGELLQGRLGPAGPVVLVTLPCPVLVAQAVFLPARQLSLLQSRRVVALDRLTRLLAHLDMPRRGRFRLMSQMPPGGGAGASTAALLALGMACGLDSGTVAKACLAVEGASDPLQFAAPERVLWASRRGQVIAKLPTMPRFEVLGGFWGMHIRTDPQDNDFPDISDLISAWPSACADLGSIADLSSQSARRTLGLRGPKDDPTAMLASKWSALGFVIAHTGSARGLIFAPGTVPSAAAADLRRFGFSRITQFKGGGGY